MSRHFYPAVFHAENTGYSVIFPDLEGCFTEGDSINEAYEMAFDAIGLYMDENDNFNFVKASDPQNIKLEKDEFIILIEFDEAEYRRKHDNRAVKKTLTIPSWLNNIAEKEGVNFSGLLQSALKEHLGVSQNAHFQIDRL